jgi:hypothetical protein
MWELFPCFRVMCSCNPCRWGKGHGLLLNVTVCTYRPKAQFNGIQIPIWYSPPCNVGYWLIGPKYQRRILQSRLDKNRHTVVGFDKYKPIYMWSLYIVDNSFKITTKAVLLAMSNIRMFCVKLKFRGMLTNIVYTYSWEKPGDNRQGPNFV